MMHPPVVRAVLVEGEGILVEGEASGLGNSKPSLSWLACIGCVGLETTSEGNSKSGRVLIPYGRILRAKTLGSCEEPSSSSSAGFTPNKSDSSLESQIRDPFLVGEMDLKDPGRVILELTFVYPHGKYIRPKTLSVLLSHRLATDDVAEYIMKKSFQNAKRHRSILVVINPYGGRQLARRRFDKHCRPILLAAGYDIEIVHTQYAKHAIDIAKTMDIERYDTIACASGDGIPHEIINGLFQRPDRVQAFRKLTLTQLPCGSGNAMSISCHWTTNPSYAALCLVKSIERRIDLMRCTQSSLEGDTSRLSFLSQTYGVIAESDINTEFIRWMGPSRFDLGVAYTTLQKKAYPCDIYAKFSHKTKQEVRDHYVEQKRENKKMAIQSARQGYSSDAENDVVITEKNFVMNYDFDSPVPDDWEQIDPKLTKHLAIFYTGKMPYIAPDVKFFPAALPSDGTIDMVITDARTSLSKTTPSLLGLDKASHVKSNEITYSKVTAYRLVPRVKSSVISIDGEEFPVEPLQVEIMPLLCKTLLKNGSFIYTEFERL